MGKYTKRPIEVEAYQWIPEDPYMAGRIAGLLIAKDIDFKITEHKCLSVWVEKSNAYIEIEHGNWMIVEPDGQGVYPCSNEVFIETYDVAAEAAE